ncbi:hypothetical protein [Neglectibacter timonensis]|uniref:hypothetical protein n=1 Tax=Neglectibacter timonensis TaxID=1776382 RepID=UPI00399B561F
MGGFRSAQNPQPAFYFITAQVEHDVDHIPRSLATKARKPPASSSMPVVVEQAASQPLHDIQPVVFAACFTLIVALMISRLSSFMYLEAQKHPP